MLKDTRFGENNNMERLQLLFTQLVMGMPDDQQIIETFALFVAQKGETWVRAQLSHMRDGYPTVVDDGEGKEYTVRFRMNLEGELSLDAASPKEATDRFLKIDPRRLPIECGFDDCVTVDGIADEDGNEYSAEFGSVTREKNRMRRCFTPTQDIPCVVTFGGGFYHRELYEGTDYVADHWYEHDTDVHFSLADDDGEIGKYVMDAHWLRHMDFERGAK